MAASNRFPYKNKEFRFVSASSDQLQELVCAVCRCLVHEPVLTVCGHLFCKGCVQNKVFSCPTCREPLNYARDNYNDRRVKALKVKCPNEGEGCEWEGDLGQAVEHLDTVCLFSAVSCPRGCKEIIKRRLVEDHLKNACKVERHQCPFCEFEGSLAMVQSHCTQCNEFLLPCPAGCGEDTSRSAMKDHLSNCGEELVACDFSIAGCDLPVKRKDLAHHVQDSNLHLKQLANNYSQVLHQLSHLCTVLVSAPAMPISRAEISPPLRPWLQNTPTCYPCPPWVVKMDEYMQRKRTYTRWFSEPFYSHFGGYKWCLSVDAYGTSDGRGTHTSVHLWLMKGENDTNLKFPFKGRIAINLLNQLEDKNHYPGTPWTPDQVIDEKISGPVTDGELAKDGWGYGKFIKYGSLDFNDEWNSQYLKNDCIFIRIDVIECTL